MTVTSFERHAVQQYFENLLGCADLAQWKSYRDNLRVLTLTPADVTALEPLLLQDALALYTQALQSFSQALTALKRKEFAWPIVKFYYAIFYAMRCELYASSVIAVKNGNIFYMANTAGGTFSSVQGKGSHQTYIKLRKNLPPSVISRDTLLDNEVENGVDVYSWMCSNRERVNYHQKHFPDPEPDAVLQKVYDNYIVTNNLSDLLNLYESNRLYCFDKDHATIAAPYHKLRICRNLLVRRAVPEPFEWVQLQEVKNSLVSAGTDVSITNNLVF